jgi:predicted alpha/beta hydrolase family esterase
MGYMGSNKMKNAIILHGKPGKEEYYDPQIPSASNYHWIPWLQKQLIVKGIAAQTPEVPLAFDPQWGLWCKEVERFEITPETILVGHSCGGGFWVRWLSEHPDVKVGKVVLVAPSLGYRWGDGGEDFFEGFKIDPELASRTKGITIFNSDNDNEAIHQAVKEIREQSKGIDYREFHLGHFTEGSMKTPEFPELLEELLK